jgi:diguanylate cyclase (GGDEF)-like protein
MKALDCLTRLPKPAVVILALVLIALVGAADLKTGYEISFSIFYLLPIMLAAWALGLWWGVGLSLLSAATWLWADVTAGHRLTLIITTWNDLMQLGFFLLITSATATIKRMLELEQELARTDGLTRIANRRAFYEMAEAELDRARRYPHPFTLIYFDLDGFKSVNDNHGHGAGDEVLQAVAGELRKNSRASDVVARLGGDEFAVLMPEIGAPQAPVAVGKVHKVLLDLMISKGLGVTFSIGAITFVTVPASVDAMVKMADELMYSVKNGGKNALKHQTYLE